MTSDMMKLEFNLLQIEDIDANFSSSSSVFLQLTCLQNGHELQSSYPIRIPSISEGLHSYQFDAADVRSVLKFEVGTWTWQDGVDFALRVMTKDARTGSPIYYKGIANLHYNASEYEAEGSDEKEVHFCRLYENGNWKLEDGLVSFSLRVLPVL